MPKKDGTFRPVFDLKSLNVYGRKEKFKMTTPRAVTHALHKGDWGVSVDLKDAYFHVPIHRKSRRLLRFAVEGSDGVRAFQFRALPFGLTSAPRVFTKVILPIGHLAHVHAVCLLQYLDDWIVRYTDKLLFQQQAKWLLGVLRRVGLMLNAQKSQLVPTQPLIHVGVEYHLDVGLIFPPMDRILRIEQKVSPIRPSNDSLLLALPAWNYELRDRCDSPRQIASETTAILLAGPLEAGVKDTVILGSGKARPDRSPPSMVVGSGVYQSWDDSGRSRSASDSVHGCVGFGLGNPCEPISGKWGMVSEGGHSSHKYVRNVSDAQLSNSISDSTGRPSGTVDVR